MGRRLHIQDGISTGEATFKVTKYGTHSVYNCTCLRLKIAHPAKMFCYTCNVTGLLHPICGPVSHMVLLLYWKIWFIKKNVLFDYIVFCLFWLLINVWLYHICWQQLNCEDDYYPSLLWFGLFLCDTRRVHQFGQRGSGPSSVLGYGV